MYKSPIDVMIADIQHQIAQQQDEEIYKAVVSVGINVDKDELIRALQYDRYQYDKGYADGTRDAEQKWIPVTERLPEESGEYLAYCGGYDGICVLYYEILKTKGKWRSKWKEVTHWMPLPEAPKGE